MTKKKASFKYFIKLLIDAESKEEAVQNIFYGPAGIDAAYQREEITWEEHEMLFALIDKMA